MLCRAKETFPQEDLSILLHRAALLLEEDGQTEAVVLLLQDVRNWKELIPLILKHAPLLIAQGRYRPLEEWVNNFAEEFYQGLMTCYHRLGRRSEALGVTSAARRTFLLALGLNPRLRRKLFIG